MEFYREAFSDLPNLQIFKSKVRSHRFALSSLPFGSQWTIFMEYKIPYNSSWCFGKFAPLVDRIKVTN